MSYRLNVAGISDVGLVRSNNEDIWTWNASEQLVVVADGMGGHQAGEVASQSAVNALCAVIKSHFDHANQEELDPQDYAELLKHSIQEVNKVVWKLSHSESSLQGMGTTLCCVKLLKDYVYWAHVGDSRIYRFRDGVLEKIMQDDSLVGQLIALGQIEENEETSFAFKNILTKAIGTDSKVEPSVYFAPAKVGDIYLLCTDGLTDLLRSHEIEVFFHSFSRLRELASELVNEAKARGGYDNITVALAKVENVK